MAIYYTPRSILAVRCTGAYTNAGLVKHDTYDYHFKPGKRVKPLDFRFRPTAITHSHSQLHDEGVILQTVRRCYDPVEKKYRDQPATWDGSLYNSFGVGRPTVVEPLVFGESAILSKIKHEGINISMMLAEYKQTASLFSSTAQSLARAYADVRAGRVSKLLKRAGRNSASTWLAARYGVTPLVYDTLNTLKEFEDQLSYSYLVRRYSVWQGASKVHTFDRSFTPPDSLVVTRPMTSNRATKVTYVAWVEYSKPNLAYISHLGLTNPLATAWEVIPYSFVLDWFIDVGTFLSNLDALVGTERVSCTKSTKSTTIEEWPGGTTGHLKNYARTVVNLGSPPLPRWKPSLSWKRVVDSVALLVGIRNKIKSRDLARKKAYSL